MNPAKWQNIKNVLSAALDLPEAERAEFLARERDAEVRSEVEDLLAAHEKAEGFIDKPILIAQGVAEDESEDSFPGTQIGNYLILERLGAGGMGAVYLAERVNSDFKQKVALKIIKRGMDSEAIIKRFATERRILSRLVHPNIAQLLDGGISSEGLPFFVMEYVEGLPLNEFCREHQLSLEERLEIFRQICAAVENAHRNLVIHRDLKPTNVIVTRDGTAKLLDFGIAKLLSDDGFEITKTATRAKIFTPEYASPEQILGKPVTTATDVYSLGVILYELLAEHRPFETKGRSFEEIVKSVCETEPRRPSAWISEFGSENSDLKETEPGSKQTTRGESKTDPRAAIIDPKLLSGDLDNIILKALRKEPAERYGSVQQFSEDILRFLQGLPVLARPQTRKYRFGKYVKRHQAGVLAAVLVLLSLIGGISVATWQAVVARRERAKSEQRFNDVRKLANSIVFEFHDSIQNLPGSTPTRELLVSRALEYLDKLASEDGHDSSLQMELAEAYDKIGDIQGGLHTSHLGQREKAEASYRKAMSVRERLVAAEPRNTDFRRGLANSYLKLGDVLWIQVKPPESLAMYQKAFEINRQVAEELPNDADLQLSLAGSQNRVGYLLGANDRFDESVDNSRQALARLEELAAADPDNDKIQEQLASAYYTVGTILEMLGQDPASALKYFQKSQNIREKRLAANLQNSQIRREAGGIIYEIAVVLEKLGENQKALESSQKSLLIFSELLSGDPQNEEFKQIVAGVETQSSGLLIKTGKADIAIKNLGKSLDALEKLSAASPTDEIVRFRIAGVYHNLGKGYVALASDGKSTAQNRLNNWRQARAYLQKSYEIFKGFRDAGRSAGDDAAIVDKIADEIAKCDSALSKKI